MDQKLFRELENIRGREKRSTFIEHLIVLGLKDYATQNDQQITAPVSLLIAINKKKKGLNG